MTGPGLLAGSRSSLAPKYTPHSLRDTFASQLLSNGVALPYVSAALSHSTVSVTSAHYLKWCGTEAYTDPVRLAEGETPADLIAKLGEKVTPDAAETN